MPIEIFPIDLTTLDVAQTVVRRYGLLASDALMIAVMQLRHINHLATNDDDMDNVQGITIWKPR